MTQSPAAPPASDRPRSFGDWTRFFARGLGQTLITLGVVVLLLVVYEVYVTNWLAHRNQQKVHSALEKEWAGGLDPLGSGRSTTIPLGVGIANLYIPRLGRDYAWTIVEGTSESDLEKGPGHYPGTALPGELGNFALAGHRVGKGEPFLNLDHLTVGDAVIVETETYWYVYRVKGAGSDLSATAPDGIPGREIVYPDNSDVLLPVPDHPGAAPTTGHYLTMTTCHPKFTATQRMVVHAVLDASLTAKRTGDTKPPAIEALYGKVGF
jgi:sortase A